MYKTTLRSRAAFTLIELLTVIAIIGILASILFPAISAAKRSAQKAADLSNIRSIGQAALIYANNNNDGLPDPSANLPATGINGGNNYQVWFGLLAQSGALTSPGVLVSKLDPGYVATGVPASILNPGAAAPYTFTTQFLTMSLSYNVVGGISATSPSTSPIAYTRGLQANGTWSAAAASTGSVYGTEGGMIVFIGGNVSQYKAVGASSPLVNISGYTTYKITETIPTAAKIYGSGDGIATTSGAAATTPGTSSAY